jgi:tellurite resistance protein TerC
VPEFALILAQADVQTWHWLAFGGFVVTVLVLDLGVFHRHSRETTLREAGIWTAIWCSLALVLNAIIWAWRGTDHAVNFLVGYLIEWSLSMDNVFVFAVIFSFFRVPRKYQYRVLFWGIIGAIFMRLAFVLIGATLIAKFHWIIYVLGAFLVYTGAKLIFHDESVDPEHSWVLRTARKYLKVSKEPHGEKFFVKEDGVLCATPLFLVLLVVETTDVAFAVDSVPAIFAITSDSFIVFTSNIFAILGLRALYFLLAGVMDMFRYLRYGLSAILIFVGIKMLIHSWIPIAPWASLLVVVGLLATSIIASLVAAKRDPQAKPDIPVELDKSDTHPGMPTGEEPQDTAKG